MPILISTWKNLKLNKNLERKKNNFRKNLIFLINLIVIKRILCNSNKQNRKPQIKICRSWEMNFRKLVDLFTITKIKATTDIDDRSKKCLLKLKTFGW